MNIKIKALIPESVMIIWDDIIAPIETVIDNLFFLSTSSTRVMAGHEGDGLRRLASL